MKTNDKLTNIQARKRDAVMSALAVEYKPEIEFDDLFNVEVDLSSAIARTDYRIKSLQSKLDEVSQRLAKLADANGSRINTEKAFMQSLEVLGNQLQRLDDLKAKYTHSLELLTIKRSALVDFFAKTIGKAYVPYSSKARPAEKSAEQRQLALQWLQQNGYKLDPVIK
tara:strand:+ start:749 stop:1252 length:504 start_codon:yes stop_codon:yes gene_type:complete